MASEESDGVAGFGTPTVPGVELRRESRLLGRVVSELAARHAHERSVYATEVAELQQALEIALKRQSEAQALAGLHAETLGEMQITLQA